MMTTRSALALLATLCLATAIFGCDSGGDSSGDPPGAEIDTTADGAVADGNAEADSGDEADSPGPVDAVPDAPPVDPCDPNPCTVQPDDACDADGAVVSYEAEGTCTSLDGQSICDYPVTGTAACGAEEICAAGACQPAGDAHDYAFAADVTWISALWVPPLTEPCCFDFNGDGDIDNKLGKLLATLESQFDANASIADAITSGDIAILFEQVGLDDVANDDDVDINGFFGDPETDYDTNLTGTGTFVIDEASFHEGTQVPLIQFGGGQINDNLLQAGPSLFVLNLPLLDGIELVLSIFDTQIEAVTAPGSGGAGLDLTEGKLGGVVPLDQLYGALNSFAASSCECLGLEDEPLVSWLGEGSKAQCSKSGDGNACSAAGEDSCTTIYGACGLVTALLSADIDTNANGIPDAISIGLLFEGMSATITGLKPDEE